MTEHPGFYYFEQIDGRYFYRYNGETSPIGYDTMSDAVEAAYDDHTSKMSEAELD